jgi:hypothetical protein
MDFIAEHYGLQYAENSREQFRKNFIKPLVLQGLFTRNPDDPNRGTNSQKTCYMPVPELIALVQAYGTKRWPDELKRFQGMRDRLAAREARVRDRHLIAVTLPGNEQITLSPGEHHRLEAAIIREFVGNPRFFKEPRVLYICDTESKTNNVDRPQLQRLSIPIDAHDDLPDVIAYDLDKNRLFLIEAFHSGGGMSSNRVLVLNRMLKNCTAAKVFVTAFQSRRDFKANVGSIAWETEVWIAEEPDHLIHFDGEKFLASMERDNWG